MSVLNKKTLYLTLLFTIFCTFAFFPTLIKAGSPTESSCESMRGLCSFGQPDPKGTCGSFINKGLTSDCKGPNVICCAPNSIPPPPPVSSTSCIDAGYTCRTKEQGCLYGEESVSFGSSTGCLATYTCCKSVQQAKCFICSYQDFPGCYGKNELACLLADNGGCSFSNGQCMSFFKKFCLREAAQRTIPPYALVTTIPYSPPKESDWTLGDGRKCTEREYIQEGHSNEEECSQLAKDITVCIQNATDTPLSSINITNAGCSTFANPSYVAALIERIQRAVDKYNNTHTGANLTVTVTANTSISVCCKIGENPQCFATSQTVTISGSGRDIPICPSGVCLLCGETIKCTDDSGKIKDRICCTNDYPLTQGHWIDGNTCPAAYVGVDNPPLTCQPSKGACSSSSFKWSCDDARNNAMNDAVNCLNENNIECSQQGGNFSQGACDVQTISKFFGCYAEVFCPWTCGQSSTQPNPPPPPPPPTPLPPPPLVPETCEEQGGVCTIFSGCSGILINGQHTQYIGKFNCSGVCCAPSSPSSGLTPPPSSPQNPSALELEKALALSAMTITVATIISVMFIGF